MEHARLAVDASTPEADCVALTQAWVEEHVPVAWRDAAARGGNAAIREVRGRADYEAWYPVFGASGLVMPTWAPEYGGLGVSPETAGATRAVLAPYNLRALNPLGLNNTAAALFAYGTEEQKRRFLPPIVRNEEKWCQLFSEPGAGSDLASLATRAVLDGDEWIVSGQKVWTTWGSDADFAILLARTDPSQAKNKGITYFLIDMHQPGVEVRPLRHISGEVEFNEVFLDQARVPEFQRLGDVNDGWRVANATLSSERQMVAGAGSGGSGRVGGSGVDRLLKLARSRVSPMIRMSVSVSPRCGARNASGRGPTNGWRRTSPPVRPRDPPLRSARCTRLGSTSGCNSRRSICSVSTRSRGTSTVTCPKTATPTTSRCRSR